MDELVRYLALTEEIRRLEDERDRLRRRAIQIVKANGGVVDDGECRVVCVAKPRYRFTDTVENLRYQTARQQRREIERGLAVKESVVEILSVGASTTARLPAEPAA
jgi:hypothetical protein